MYYIYLEILTQVIQFATRTIWTEGTDRYAQEIANKRNKPVLVIHEGKPIKRFVPEASSDAED